MNEYKINSDIIAIVTFRDNVNNELEAKRVAAELDNYYYETLIGTANDRSMNVLFKYQSSAIHTIKKGESIIIYSDNSFYVINTNILKKIIKF